MPPRATCGVRCAHVLPRATCYVRCATCGRAHVVFRALSAGRGPRCWTAEALSKATRSEAGNRAERFRAASSGPVIRVNHNATGASVRLAYVAKYIRTRRGTERSEGYERRPVSRLAIAGLRTASAGVPSRVLRATCDVRCAHVLPRATCSALGDGHGRRTEDVLADAVPVTDHPDDEPVLIGG